MDFACTICGKRIDDEQTRHSMQIRAAVSNRLLLTFLVAHADCWRRWITRYARPYPLPASTNTCAACNRALSTWERQRCVERTITRGSRMLGNEETVELLRIHDHCWSSWASRYTIWLPLSRRLPRRRGLAIRLAMFIGMTRLRSRQMLELLRGGYSPRLVFDFGMASLRAYATGAARR